MSKRLSIEERITEYFLTANPERVAQTLLSGKAILNSRVPKPEKTAPVRRVGRPKKATTAVSSASQSTTTTADAPVTLT